MKMMKDFKTPILKQAKIAFLMSIPLVDVRLVKKLRASAETLRFDQEKRINRLKSKDGSLKIEGVHDEKTKRAAFEYIDDDDDDFETEVMPQKRVRGAPGDQNVVQRDVQAVDPTLARAEMLTPGTPKKVVKIPLFCSGVTKTKKLQPLLESEKKKIDSLKEKGWNRTKIAKSVGRSVSLVNKYINDPQGYGIRKPGRPRRS
ncbi:hypothetical protein CAEBREN_22469 [Caenorhabditis brenneri]|uniref:SPK domain-containing protein n=1 Tax=Caenorhabditis brenneri TaxID=135651 RepID=G0N4E0_CAEBE|nr:hypothetical protein CAEBREN_22469 [Caenorhabditis brenneri]